MTIEVGRKIGAVRRRHGLTQEALAERAEVTTSHIARIETGQRAPSVDTLAQVAAALDVPVAELLPVPKVQTNPLERRRAASLHRLAEALEPLAEADIKLLAGMAERLGRGR